MFGYSLHLQKLNKAASAKNIGVRLGRYCIRCGIPVITVAEQFGVSRQAVYNWFSGKSAPSKDVTKRISKLYSL